MPSFSAQADEAALITHSLNPAPDNPNLYLYSAVITDVYDGDTITADIDLGFEIWRKGEKLRLYRIDAPEIRGANKQAAIKSRDFLREKLMNRQVTIETIKDRKGKYGRYLAEIWLDGENINDQLVAHGYAIYRAY